MHPDLRGVDMQTMGWCTAGNEQEALALKAELQARLAECRPEMHPTKTKIVYCKDGNRKGKSIRIFDMEWIRLSVPDGLMLRLDRHAILGLQPGRQRFGVEGHAGGDLEPRSDIGQTCLSMRCEHGRSIRSCGGGSNTTDDTRRRLCILCSEIRQSDASGLGDAEVCYHSSQDPHECFRKIGSGKSGSVRALAIRHDRYVRLMSAAQAVHAPVGASPKVQLSCYEPVRTLMVSALHRPGSSLPKKSQARGGHDPRADRPNRNVARDRRGWWTS